MNKKLLALAIAAFCTLCISCKTEEEKVNDVAQNYLEAITNYKMNEAKKYVSDDFMPEFKWFKKHVGITPREQLNKNLPNEVTITQTDLNADTAIIHFHSKNPSQENDAMLKMVKIKNQWLVFDQGDTIQ